jgi:hypothetical protein
MRALAVIAALLPLISGCESMSNRIDASRQDRCQRAEWVQVGERDGFEGYRTMADRYAHICGDMFQSEPYQEGLKKGLARRPTPPV